MTGYVRVPRDLLESHCMNRYPKSEAIVVPQPPPYQELRYCTVACIVDQAAQVAAEEEE